MRTWRVSLLAVVFAAAATLHADDAFPILTPPPPPSPQIHSPKVYGARPSHEFLYRIPATGVRPMSFAAKGLPSSLKLDTSTGIITGTAPEKVGRYPITFTAKNAKGKSSRKFTLVVGDMLALTPQMGWNDWYTHYDHITDAKMRQAADAMISSGMADFGYQFVDIDDAWERQPGSTNDELNGAPRDSNGNILPNKRFPDMKSLTDYIHSKGLRAGIYSSPGPLTCGKFEGSYQHEEQDAKQYAAWGFDLLKYDWCSYGKIAKDKSNEERQKPYILMGGILKNLNRDIELNLCQYGMNAVWTWGKQIGGQSWRTTGDLGNAKDTRLPGFYSIAFANARHAEFAGPGGWNDPDYLLLGKIESRHPTKNNPMQLTADEQYSYMSMWALMASPLFFSGDMAKLDAFTLNVLCNAEVIDIDQDELGKQSDVIRQTDNEFILARRLADGSVAVGLFNLSGAPLKMTATWSDLGLHGYQRVRDVWRQKNLPLASGSVSAEVNSHGVAFFRLYQAL